MQGCAPKPPTGSGGFGTELGTARGGRVRHVQAQPDRSAAMPAVDTTWPVRVSGL